MEALVFDGQTNELKYEPKYRMAEITRDDEVLVKVAYSGVCGTDLHIIKGEFPAQKDKPLVLGHEFSGVIHQIGAKSQFKVGQRVVVDPNIACNLCGPCRKGSYQYCKTKVKRNLGVFRDGGWAQYVAVPDVQVFPLPNHVSLEEGGLCEPYSCVSHGFDRASPISVGQKILIVGAGIIGNLWTTTLHHQGHRDVTVAEMNTTRLDIVKKLDTGFRLITPDVLEKENQLYDVIIDCTGVGKVLEINFNLLDDGGKYVVFGCCPPTHRASLIPFNVFDKELTLIGVKVNPFSFPTAIGWISAMGQRYLSYEKLGVKTYSLQQYKDALEDLKNGRISKAMLKIDDTLV